MLIDVHMRDALTGERRVYRTEWDGSADGLDFMWSEGSYACDCARSAFFAEAAGEDDPERECGSVRYIVEKIAERGTDRVVYDGED